MDIKEENDLLKIKQVVLKPEKPYYYFRKVKAKEAFRLKKNSREVISEIFSLEDLLKALERAPQEAIIFHLQEGNDFATWVEKVIEHKELAEKLNKIKLTHPEETRWKLVSVIYNALPTKFYSDYLR